MGCTTLGSIVIGCLKELTSKKIGQHTHTHTHKGKATPKAKRKPSFLAHAPLNTCMGGGRVQKTRFCVNLRFRLSFLNCFGFPAALLFLMNIYMFCTTLGNRILAFPKDLI